MPDQKSELAQALTDAEAAVRDLSEKVTLNEAATARANTAASRARFASKAALFGILLDMVLTVLVWWGLIGVDQNQGRINDLQVQQQEQVERNRTAQCAVNALLLQFEPRTTTNPAYTEEQRAEQRQVYATLRQISRDLGCPGQ